MNAVILSAFLILAAQVNSEETQLRLVQILFRHGDRAPIDLYPNDPNNASFWPEGLGSLTKLGRQQHYALGKTLRSYYKGFVTSSPLEVRVNSAETDRCMKSALSNFASFYEPTKEWTFEDDYPWQPIIVKYIPTDVDKFLDDESVCPRAHEEQKKIVQSAEGQAFIAKHKEMFQNLSIHSGRDVVNWTIAGYLYDVINIERAYNLTVPTWVDPWWSELEAVRHMGFFLNFNSTELHRLRAGPFLARVVANIYKKMAGNLTDIKFEINSSHDSNLAAVMAALGIFNMRQPPLASSLVFEFREIGDFKSYFVRILYFNSSTPESGPQEPHVLRLDGCAELCPLEVFINKVWNLINVDWEKECQLDKSLVDKIGEQKISVGWFFLILLAVVAMMTGFGLKRYCRKNRKSLGISQCTLAEG